MLHLSFLSRIVLFFMQNVVLLCFTKNPTSIALDGNPDITALYQNQHLDSSYKQAPSQRITKDFLKWKTFVFVKLTKLFLL